MEQRTLFDRLGGSDAIAAVVDDFIGRCAADARIKRLPDAPAMPAAPVRARPRARRTVGARR